MNKGIREFKALQFKLMEMLLENYQGPLTPQKLQALINSPMPTRTKRHVMEFIIATFNAEESRMEAILLMRILKHMRVQLRIREDNDQGYDYAGGLPEIIQEHPDLREYVLMRLDQDSALDSLYDHQISYQNFALLFEQFGTELRAFYHAANYAVAAGMSKGLRAMAKLFADDPSKKDLFSREFVDKDGELTTEGEAVLLEAEAVIVNMPPPDELLAKWMGSLQKYQSGVSAPPEEEVHANAHASVDPDANGQVPEAPPPPPVTQMIPDADVLLKQYNVLAQIKAIRAFCDMTVDRQMGKDQEASQGKILDIASALKLANENPGVKVRGEMSDQLITAVQSGDLSDISGEKIQAKAEDLNADPNIKAMRERHPMAAKPDMRQEQDKASAPNQRPMRAD